MLEISERTRQVELPLFGIDDWTARTTVTKPDKQQVVAGDGISHRVTLRTHEDGRTLLAVVSMNPRLPERIVALFPIPDAVGIQNTPMDTLVALCDKYGADITVGGVTTNLVIGREDPENLQVAMNRITQGVMRGGPSGHEFAGASSVRASKSGTTDFAFFFMVDVTAIAKDVGR